MALLLERRKRRILYELDKMHNLIFNIMLTFNAVSTVLIYSCINFSASSIAYVVFLSFVLLLLTTLVFSCVFDIAYKAMFSREENKRIKAQLAYNDQQYERDRENLLDIKRLLHDLSKHMSVIKQAIKDEENNYAISCMDQAFGKINHFYGSAYSGNFVIDTLVYNLLKRSEKRNITFSYHFALKEALKMPDQDLVIILGNLFENAEHPWIDVIIYTRNQYLVILVKTKRNDHVKKERFIDKTKISRGLGLNNVRHTVKKYNGMVNTEKGEQNFFVKVLLPL